MALVGADTARCAGGHHRWEPIDGIRRAGVHREQCVVCGARGVWAPIGLTWDAE